MNTTAEHMGHALVDRLIEFGVDHIFGLPGGQTGSLYDAIIDRPGQMRHVLVRDEETSAYAADAFARLTGRIGVCDATVGPGTAKLPSGLGEANNSSIPVLALVSDLPASMAIRRYRGAASQELDQEALLRPVTKWVGTVRSAADLDPLLRRAVRVATTGRPGAVALIIPQDVLDSARIASPGPMPEQEARTGSFPSMRRNSDASEIAEAARILADAKRPLLIAGGGALLSGVGSDLVELAELLGAPVATTLSGKGVIDETSPYSIGVAGGTGGSPAAREIFERADVVLAVGVKFGSNLTHGWQLPTAQQQVIQIDVDPVELGRDFPLAAQVCADAAFGVAALLGEIRRAGNTVSRDEWLMQSQEALAAWHEQRDEEMSATETPLHPQRVMRALQTVLDEGAIVVSDASLSSGWAGLYLTQRTVGRQVLFPRGMAGLGWALPAAIGAAVAEPEKPIVVLVGDGALAYAIGELSVLTQLGLNVSVLVLNNSSLGWIRWYSRITFGRGHEKPDFDETNFAAVAAAYGMDSVRVESPDELDDAVKRISDGPVFIDARTDAWQTPIFAHRHALATGTRTGYGA